MPFNGRPKISSRTGTPAPSFPTTRMRRNRRTDWSRRLVAENQLDTGCMASPAVIGNDLLIRTKTHLYRICEGKP